MNSSDNITTNLTFGSWLIDITEISPGRSAILSGNKLSFYAVHGIAIIIMCISLSSCLTVITSIYRQSKKRGKWDFSDRFPLYLAISDGLWAIMNLCFDQTVLLVYPIFPSKSVATLLSLNVAFFFGYQQLMNGGLSIYTYLKVVRKISIDLGYLEWKLHLFAITFMIINLATFYQFDAYGCSGYWFLMDFNTTGGTFLTLTICIFNTVHAICTLLAYRAIQKIISKQRHRMVVSNHEHSFSQFLTVENNHQGIEGTLTNVRKQNQHYHSTATNCLTTFIYISICLYCPFAITSWALFIESQFGFLEPFTVLMIVILANSGGWEYAWGYFHNKRIKDERRNAISKKAMLCTSVSTSSNTNNN